MTSKQILRRMNERELLEQAYYLVISFPFHEEMCRYTDSLFGELCEDKYPLVSKGVWTGIIELRSHNLLNWSEEYGDIFFQAKVSDSGTYFLLGKDNKALCRISGYVPNRLIPDADGCGDYIRLRIKSNGTIENWPDVPDFSEFIDGAMVVDRIDGNIKEEPVFNVCMDLTYDELMDKLFRLPKHLQMEIGKALIENASGNNL